MWPEVLPRPPVHPTKELLAMAAILITTVPLHGHVLPALSIARELTARGHQVRWYTGRAFRPQVEAAGATYVPMTLGPGEHSLDEVRDWPGPVQAPNLRQFVHDLEHLLIRREYTADVRAHLADASADLVLADTVFFAGGLVHELGGPPWAAYGITAGPRPQRPG
jgi:UDP:flavonoid glycosyltransferase YjiC (YdhE family)